jgi:homocysteine S-methyltransferase
MIGWRKSGYPIIIYKIHADMNPITSILGQHAALVIDGALATELERRGCNLNDALWSAKILLEQPEIIKQVHLDYFRAGADCAITASYQASIEDLPNVD